MQLVQAWVGQMVLVTFSRSGPGSRFGCVLAAFRSRFKDSVLQQLDEDDDGSKRNKMPLDYRSAPSSGVNRATLMANGGPGPRHLP